jgi:F-type H+-transporting ATPase subunit b
MSPDARKPLTDAALLAGFFAVVPAALAQDEAQDDHAADDHATDGHAGAHETVGALPTVKQGLATGITAIIVFALVFIVLRAKVWPVISKGLDERADKIKSEIEAAAAARKQAADALETYQQNLAEARAEAQKMLDETRTQQQKMAADLKAKADVELNDMRDKARRDIEAAKRAALNEIYAEASTMATQIAGKILAREVNAGDHQRLIDESLAELQAASN